jgi:hypothetical protein
MKKRTRTEKEYLKLKAGSVALNSGVFLCPIIPGTIITCINAEKWFAAKPYSIGLGFATLLLTMVMAILMVVKKSDTFKNVSKLWGSAILMVMLGVSFMFLAEVAGNLGMMFLATAGGIAGSGICNEVDKLVLKPKLEHKKLVIEGAGLNRKENAKKLKLEQDIKRAKEEAENIGGIL